MIFPVITIDSAAARRTIVSSTTLILRTDTVPKSMTLPPLQAQDLMTQNPKSIDEDATINESATALTDARISALPVTNHDGELVGVLSRADIVRLEGERGDFEMSTSNLGPGEVDAAEIQRGFHVDTTRRTPVKKIMPPSVYVVRPEANLVSVVDQMLKRHVHRLYVIDSKGKLIGVVSALDLLRALKR
jgi:CBS domain-containing protein